ncbi:MULTISPECIES: DUF202 domain-containing protein [unclassified Nocardioides]|uniref:DUF202 domain-containing protein n=1 Tax=unclassified Nocardioides TaxID=2615069 RepID=UPI000703799B|nr:MULTISPECIES: DUF202 domain-containing protein [unclassified Nocardioides]KQZ74886.1 hypothetical protein ASD66_00395 [Nocardioides sp. Root151]KRF10420.1 hypothetical protein ASH02_20130 [Nocardioides sp. Soil796]
MSVAADPGLANERTALAWQRTALSLMVCAAILARLTYGDLGGAAFTVLGPAFLLSLWVFVESRGRYRRTRGTRAARRRRGGRAPLTVAVATCLLCLTETTVLLLS